MYDLARAVVIFDPRTNVSDEAQVALRFLSRGFFSARTDGNTWTLERKGTGFAEHSTFRLRSPISNDVATIAFDATRSVSGSRIIQTTEHGTMQYETTLLVPQSYTSKLRSIENLGTRRRSTDELIELRLTSDTFAKQR